MPEFSEPLVYVWKANGTAGADFLVPDGDRLVAVQVVPGKATCECGAVSVGELTACRHRARLSGLAFHESEKAVLSAA